MTTQTRLMTAEELLRLAEDHQRHELVDGVLTTMPFNSTVHGSTAAALAASLGSYVADHKLGVALVGCGFILRRNPDTVRAADISFITQERMAPLGRLMGYPPLAPDLAVEIIDPWERYLDVMDKIADWLAAGTHMVLVINPRHRTVRVHRAPTAVSALAEDDQIDGADVVPGWAMPVGALFE